MIIAANKNKKVRQMNIKKTAFTLAEVLITITLIGIVAAMTIPTLISNYQQKAWDEASQVFEIKLEEALKTMNTQQVLAGYKSTSNFVNALSKYFKITKICANNDILSCFEDKVIWGDTEVDMSGITAASHLGQKDWDTETIGVQFANGVTGVIAYNPDCKQDPYSNQIVGTSCLALLYDVTGYKKPNTQSKDLNEINVLGLGGEDCTFEVDGICFIGPFSPQPLSMQECIDEKDTLKIKNCRYDSDSWAGAVKTCGGVDKMATPEHLATIARSLYNNSGIDASFNGCDLNIDEEKASLYKIGNTANYTDIFSNKEIDDWHNGNQAYIIESWQFGKDCAYGGSPLPRTSNAMALCVK